MARILKVTVRTNRVGSEVQDTLELDESVEAYSEDDLEEIARDMMFQNVDWFYEIVEE